jgi:DUF4097 and DUF4098 domain-containing protein YvlB
MEPFAQSFVLQAKGVLMRALPLLALALCLAGCDFDDFDGGRRVEETFHEAHALKPGGRVAVENFNGSVEIVGWEKDQVEINATKYAPTQGLLSMMKVEVTATADTVRVRVIRPDFRRGNMGARMTISVPRKVELERIQSSNGTLRVSDVEGAAHMRTSNGTIRVSKLLGSLEATTSNGAIEVRDLKGNASLATSNGRISADLSGTQSGAANRFQTSTGPIDVRLEGSLASDVRAHTSNGSVTLRLPASINARLNASTSNSTVSTDFDLMVHGGAISKRHMSGTLGSGGPTVDITTSNGSIKVLRL